jgi:hypothetical protein
VAEAMIEDVKILSARRAYEFGADDLRLTTLTTKPFLQAIQDMYSFQLAQVATPIPTFGSVPGTIPPGVVYNYGLWAQNEGVSVPIRFLHIEQRRIVIDVAGSSSLIDAIYDRFRRIVRDLSQALRLSSDMVAIGEAERVRDFSEVTFKSSWTLDAVFLPAVRALFAEGAGIANTQSSMNIPTVYTQPHVTGEELEGGASAGLGESVTLQLAPRAGTLPEDHIQFSGVLLTTEDHLDYLKRLDIALS